MWYFTISEPHKKPRLIQLKPGKFIIGRSQNNDINIEEESVSRQHAEVIIDPATDSISIVDLNSTNGTYVNRQRIQGAFQLAVNDDVHIGKTSMILVHFPQEKAAVKDNALGTHPLTSEVVHESVDQNSALLCEISSKLNTVLDIKTALYEVSELIKRMMGVDKCEILIGKQIVEVRTSEFSSPLAKQALKNRCAEVTPAQMFVPIICSEELLGLIIIFRSNIKTQPFDRHDLQLAIAISHQAALTIQRMYLTRKLNHDEQVHRLLLRFVSPLEAEFMLNDYLESGELPPLCEQKITVLFADIANSTALAEHLGSKQFAEILNNFYKKATEIAFKHTGIVKYLGDGVLAIFTEQANRWPSEERATLAGLELIRTVNYTGSLNPQQRIVVGVGINTGNVMAGYVGTHERAEFVALGDAVNVAYRMQDYARPYKVIVGPATVAAISDKYQFQRVGAITLRGREHSIQAYEVLPLSNKFQKRSDAVILVNQPEKLQQ